MKTSIVTAFLFAAVLPGFVQAQSRLKPPVESLLWATSSSVAAEPAGASFSARSISIAPEQQSRDCSVRGTIGAALLSSLGSFGGFYAGALIGYSTGEYEENIGGLFIGGAVGSALGATMGSTAFTGRMGRSFLGSLGGGLVGLLAGMAVHGATDNEAFTWATYSLTHGTVTALVASR
jgi:hypothetical protein